MDAASKQARVGKIRVYAKARREDADLGGVLPAEPAEFVQAGRGGVGRTFHFTDHYVSIMIGIVLSSPKKEKRPRKFAGGRVIRAREETY